MSGALQHDAQAADQQAAHEARIAKPHLGLGRMHVDVDLARIEIDEDREQRMTAARHQVAVGRAHRAEQQPVAHGPAVDEQKLQAAVGPVQGRQAGEAGDARAVARAVELQRIVQKFPPHDAAEPLQASRASRAHGLQRQACALARRSS